MIVLLHGAPAWGAVEEYVAAIADGLAAAGEDACLLYPDVPALARFSDLQVRHERFDPKLLSGSSVALAKELRARLRRLQPDVVHVTDVWPVALVAARLAGVRRLVVTHHTPELPRNDNVVGRAWWILGWLSRPTVVYTSEADRLTDGRRLLRTLVVPLGIDVERFQAAGRDAQPRQSGPVIGNVARLSQQKGHRYLIEAAPIVLERYPDATFVVAGDGDLRQELEQQAQDLGVAASFDFLGTRDDIPDLLGGFDVFAFPSLFEGLCLAVVEAQAAGVPVVATGVGGMRETVVAEQTGLLCELRDPVSLAAGILALLDDPVRARALSDEAARRATRYDRSRMVAETIAIYGGAYASTTA